MGMKVDVIFHGNRLGFSLRKICRANLYGTHRRIAFDSQERECATALMTKDGRHLFGAGGLASLYLDANGDVVDVKDLAVSDKSDDLKEVTPPADGDSPELSGPVPAAALLDYMATAVYRVDDLDPGSPLAAALACGEIYQLPFRPRASSHGGTAFLLANEHGVFMVTVQPARFEFIGLDAPVAVDEDSPDETSDLDFEDWRETR